MNLILLYETDFLDESKKVVRLNGHRKEHILSICKASVGEKLKAGLFGGLMGSAEIIRIDESFIEMNVNLNQPPPQPLPLTLILALPRPKSLKKSLEVATTLGIKKIYIIESWRVEKSYWNSPVLTNESIAYHISLGLEQARDTVPPQIQLRRRFKPFVQDELPDLICGCRAFVAHPYDSIPCPYSLKKPAVLAVGPEGGFIPYEIELFKTQGFEVVSLGERILRVEQAIAALSGRLF